MTPIILSVVIPIAVMSLLGYIYLLISGKKDNMNPYISFKNGLEIGVRESEKDRNKRISKLKRMLTICEKNNQQLYRFEEAPKWLNEDLDKPKGSGHLSILSSDGKQKTIRHNNGVEVWFSRNQVNEKGFVFKGVTVEKRIIAVPVMNLKNYYIGE